MSSNQEFNQEFDHEMEQVKINSFVMTAMRHPETSLKEAIEVASKFGILEKVTVQEFLVTPLRPIPSSQVADPNVASDDGIKLGQVWQDNYKRKGKETAAPRRGEVVLLTSTDATLRWNSGNETRVSRKRLTRSYELTTG